MIRALLITVLMLVTASLLMAQTIKRWSGSKIEMTNKTISYEIRANIFNDFKWTYPDIKSIPVEFVNGKGTFSIGGRNFSAVLMPSNKMKIAASDEWEITSEEKISDGNMYFDKSNLKTKAVTQQVWTSFTTMSSQSVPVQKSRQVTTYSYQNGRSVPQYRTEYYTVYEWRPVTKTEWRYVPRTVYVLDIPQYPYYSFMLKGGLNFVIYKTDGDKYYCQNSSYLIATDDSKINHLIIDVNSNGSFLDNTDKVMFNSWDPYSPKSMFRSAGAFRENNWYDIQSLRESNFLTFSLDESAKKLTIEYENSRFSGEDAKGKVTLSNLPEGVKLFINGGQYPVKKKEATFKSQYGKFVMRIERQGYMDFERTYVIDANNPNQQIVYELTVPAGYVTIQNIPDDSYFVTVTNTENYSRIYSNRPTFTIPTGKCTITYASNGVSFSKEVDLSIGEGTLLDYVDEVDLLKSDTEPASEEDESIKK